MQKARLVEPKRAVNIRTLELETAKEILAEGFGARPGEVEEMIQRRLEEMGRQHEREKGLRPAIFCRGSSYEPKPWRVMMVQNRYRKGY